LHGIVSKVVLHILFKKAAGLR